MGISSVQLHAPDYIAVLVENCWEIWSPVSNDRGGGGGGRFQAMVEDDDDDDDHDDDVQWYSQEMMMMMMMIYSIHFRDSEVVEIGIQSAQKIVIYGY